MPPQTPAEPACARSASVRSVRSWVTPPWSSFCSWTANSMRSRWPAAAPAWCASVRWPGSATGWRTCRSPSAGSPRPAPSAAPWRSAECCARSPRASTRCCSRRCRRSSATVHWWSSPPARSSRCRGRCCPPAGRPVTIVPSATLWHPALPPPAAGPRHGWSWSGVRPAGRAVEAATVAALYPGASLSGWSEAAPSTRSPCDGAALVHLAAHGDVRADNPLFSSLLLADGPLTVYDLERLPAPRTTSSSRPATRAGCTISPVTKLLGIRFRAAGSRGTEITGGPGGSGAPMRPPCPLDDGPITDQLIGAAGHPAESLAAAQQLSIADGPAARAAAAAFVCTGAGLVA